ncbi:MAG: hypothetical protein Kow0089_23750 [Desulfobulbaceae bacterium]
MRTAHIITSGTTFIRRAILCITTVFMLLASSACTSTVQQVATDAGKPVRSSVASVNDEIISAYELHKILTDQFGYISIKLSDANYSLPDTDTILQLKNSAFCDPSGRKGMEGWGSDDFAIAEMVPMRNSAFGTMYVPSPDGKKVMNILVNRDREIIYWEPVSCQYLQAAIDKPELILF